MMFCWLEINTVQEVHALDLPDRCFAYMELIVVVLIVFINCIFSLHRQQRFCTKSWIQWIHPALSGTCPVCVRVYASCYLSIYWQKQIIVTVEVWLSDAALVLIIKVTLRQAQVVLEWWLSLNRQTISVHYQPPGQLILAVPSWVGTMSASKSWDIYRHTL